MLAVPMSAWTQDNKPPPAAEDVFGTDSPENKYLHDVLSGYKRQEETPCPACDKYLKKYKEAWGKLDAFYKAHPKFGDWFKANLAKSVADAAALKGKAGDKKLGAAVKEAKTALDKATGNLKTNEPKAKPDDLLRELKDIAGDIKVYGDALKQCEDEEKKAGRCKKGETPPPPDDGGTTPPTGGEPPPATELELPPPPGKCASDAELNEYIGKLDNIRSNLQGKRRGFVKNKSAMDKSDPNFDKFQKEIDKIDGQIKRVDELLNKAETELKKPQADRLKIAMCLPPTESGEFPGTPTGGQGYVVFTATDGEVWCTYGDGVGEQTTLIEIPIEIPVAEETPPPSEETPVEPEIPMTPEVAITPTGPIPETPTVAETVPEEPPTTPETPQTTEKVPEEPPTTPVPEEPTTPETPETTEKVPEEPTSPIPDTIFVKAKEAVLEGATTGAPIENQVVKLFPAEEPELPGTGETKEAEDTGFDKDPVECMTGAGGDCAMQIPADDRQAYDLTGADEEPGRNYRVDYDLPKDSGGVAETTNPM